MKIGIIGAGNIGANAARLFVKAGHEIAIANSRGAETLKDLVADSATRHKRFRLKRRRNLVRSFLFRFRSANIRRFRQTFSTGKSSLTRTIIIQTATGFSLNLTTIKRLRAKCSPNICAGRAS
jgi:NAD(P)-dependent dehydrogenase (short-subunit alcohol dehydrogenase family)